MGNLLAKLKVWAPVISYVKKRSCLLKIATFCALFEADLLLQFAEDGNRSKTRLPK